MELTKLVYPFCIIRDPPLLMEILVVSGLVSHTQGRGFTARAEKTSQQQQREKQPFSKITYCPFNAFAQSGAIVWAPLGNLNTKSAVDGLLFHGLKK